MDDKETTSTSQFDSNQTDTTFKKEDEVVIRLDRNSNVINLTKNRYERIEKYRKENGYPEDLSKEDDLPDDLRRNYTKDKRHAVTFMDRVTKEPH